MKLLFLANNEISAPLMHWLEARSELTLWQEKLSPEQLQGLTPDLIVSYSYSHILSAPVLATCPDRFLNLHISLLPYNRGADPNAWSFLDDTPKGVSIHRIDPGIDTGGILLQEEVTFDEPAETLGHSYQVLQERIQSLFRTHWEELCANAITPRVQTTTGTFHKASEFKAIKDTLLGPEGWDVPIPLFRQRYARLKQLL